MKQLTHSLFYLHAFPLIRSFTNVFVHSYFTLIHSLSHSHFYCLSQALIHSPSRTHSLTLNRIDSSTHSFSPSLINSLPLLRTQIHALTLSHTQSHSLTHTCTLSPSYTQTSLALFLSHAFTHRRSPLIHLFIRSFIFPLTYSFILSLTLSPTRITPSRFRLFTHPHPSHTHLHPPTFSLKQTLTIPVTHLAHSVPPLLYNHCLFHRVYSYIGGRTEVFPMFKHV